MAQNGFPLIGMLYRVFDTEAKQNGDKTYYSRKFVIRLHEEYNGSDYYQFVPCELRGETKCKLIDSWTAMQGDKPGDAIKIHCNMRGVKYNPKDAPNEEKYFSGVDVWKIEKAPQEYAQLSATDAHAAKIAWDKLSPDQQRAALAAVNGNSGNIQPSANYSGNSSNYNSTSNFNHAPETIDDLPF